VSRVVLLDAGPIGLLTNPKHSPANDACARWLQTLANANVRIIVPEIADYEVRRELIRLVYSTCHMTLLQRLVIDHTFSLRKPLPIIGFNLIHQSRQSIILKNFLKSLKILDRNLHRNRLLIFIHHVVLSQSQHTTTMKLLHNSSTTIRTATFHTGTIQQF
jgi:hypothetical protein